MAKALNPISKLITIFVNILCIVLGFHHMISIWKLKFHQQSCCKIYGILLKYLQSVALLCTRSHLRLFFQTFMGVTLQNKALKIPLWIYFWVLQVEFTPPMEYGLFVFRTISLWYTEQEILIQNVWIVYNQDLIRNCLAKFEMMVIDGKFFVMDKRRKEWFAF